MKKIVVSMVENDAEDVRASIRKKHKHEEEAFDGKLLSTGSSLLNLALSDRVDGGYMEGKYYWLVGDSASGKTFLAMTCFAEAQLNSNFEKHRLIFDNVEDGALMDMEKFFGKAVQKKIEPPRKKDGKAVFSDTIEDFFFHIDDALNDGRPFIYVLDSMDAVSSKDEKKKFDEHKKAARKDTQGGKEPAGSFGDGKAKKNSSMIQQMHARLKKTKSIVIIISQTRDNIDAGMFEEKRTQSGGKALRFYATCQILTTVTGTLKKKVGVKDRKIGHKVGIECKKNRVTGKLAKIETAIYPSYGLDDVGSCIDWLVAEAWWKKSEGGSTITAKEFDLKSNRKDLIALIEKGGKWKDLLHKALRRCWRWIQEQMSLDRPPRYV